MTSSTALIVIAKAPTPGRSKTRLSPPCSPVEAASLAEAALKDTLDAVCETPCARRILVFDGDPAPWGAPGLEVIPQVAGGLDVRLAGAFDAVGGPALLVGMDTPQLDPGLLESSIAILEGDGCDCVLGPALDGGWWSIGLRAADPQVFLGLPMSSVRTAKAQRGRLRELGLRHYELPELRDVDTIHDARIVAGLAPESRFARALRWVDRPAEAA